MLQSEGVRRAIASKRAGWKNRPPSKAERTMVGLLEKNCDIISWASQPQVTRHGRNISETIIVDESINAYSYVVDPEFVVKSYEYWMEYYAPLQGSVARLRSWCEEHNRQYVGLPYPRDYDGSTSDRIDIRLALKVLSSVIDGEADFDMAMAAVNPRVRQTADAHRSARGIRRAPTFARYLSCRFDALTGRPFDDLCLQLASVAFPDEKPGDVRTLQRFREKARQRERLPLRSS